MFADLIARQNPNDCTAVSTICPVEASIYGYYPNLPANAFFLAVFALSFFAHLLQGVRYRTWSFMIAMTFGAALEVLGQGGRIMLHSNPFDPSGFKLQIVCLTIAPAFFAAGVYLQLKHLVITFGSDFSRLRPALYTYVFVSCDILSIALQGIGGGLASAADDNPDMAKAGQNVMLAGLVFQVFTLLVFFVFAADYFLKVRQNLANLNPATVSLRSSKKFNGFLVAMGIAYFTILFRCIYRVAEMAGGWRNSIMQDEITFIILDSCMCTITTLVLNAFHPGYCFDYRNLVAFEGQEKKTSVSSSENPSDVYVAQGERRMETV